MGFAKRRNLASPLRLIAFGFVFRRLLIAAWIKPAGDKPAPETQWRRRSVGAGP